MKSRFIALSALGLACILAAGGGAYLAVRQSMQSTGAVEAATSPASPATGAPAGVATTPPAPADNTPAASPAPSASVPERSATPKTPVREPARSARRNRVERPASPVDAEAAAAGANQADVSRTGVPPVSSDPGVQQPPVPQPISQAPPEPAREWVEVTVPAETVLGLQIQTPVSSETARIEDRVEARVTREIRVDDRVAIPAGSEAIGSVVQVERGGKVKDRARIALRFNSLILPDGTRLALTAEAVHREGPSPANKSAARIGGATVGGAILGAILGGGKGAAIGGAIGAGGGTAATMASDRQPAILAAGSIVNIRLMSPVTVTLER